MTPYDVSTDVMGVSEFGVYGAYRPTNNLGVVTVMRFYQGDLLASDPEPSAACPFRNGPRSCSCP